MAINSLKQSLKCRYYSPMFQLLLCIIYVSFISLGLPDALLGSAWPSIYPTFNVPVSFAGIVSLIISFGTIISSLNSDRLTHKLGTGKVTAISVGLTALAIFGFSISTSFISLCLWAIPYGLGAGSVDAALNNYVAIHYKSKHMSWLHSMWGVGAAVGPHIMGYVMTNGGTWNGGYRVISIIQAVLTLILFLSLPLWKNTSKTDTTNNTKILSFKQVISINGVKQILVCFFCYCALEQTTGLWASSYLSIYKGMDATEAASFASMFFIGITVGRILSGFLTLKFNDDTMVRIGHAIIAIGIIILFLPLDIKFSLAAFVIIGLGCAPVYPCIIHATPSHFGQENSQAIIGLQMASAYVGSSLMPPFFGLLANHISLALLPYYLSAILVLMALMHASLVQKVKKVTK